MSTTVFLGLGGNHDNTAELLNITLRKIDEIAAKIVKTSSIYQTPPWGFEAENDFLNSVVQIIYEGNAEHLLEQINKIETDLGRVRTGSSYTSRPIDIDILYFGNQKINTSTLIVPHPRMYTRNFVLHPLNEICSFWIDPVKKISVNILFNQCIDDASIIKFSQRNSE